MKDCRVIFYDLETTGLDSENDKIIEIAGKDNNGEIFSKLINPKVNISNKIEEITGISNDNVKYRNNIEQNRSKIEEWFDFGNKTQDCGVRLPKANELFDVPEEHGSP